MNYSGQCRNNSFDFRVQDSHSSWSIPMTAKIQIVSGPMEIAPYTSDRAQEDLLSTIVMQGRDDTGLNRSLGFFSDGRSVDWHP